MAEKSLFLDPISQNYLVNGIRNRLLLPAQVRKDGYAGVLDYAIKGFKDNNQHLELHLEADR